MNEYTTHIKAKTGWFDVDLKEIWRYRDLIFLFVKRNYTTRYKQTILGPMWLILNPLITVLLYSFVFGNLAGLSTDGSPQIAFYLCSNAIWTYFATCINSTSNTFISNANIMGKVYYPRLVMPISAVITGLLDLFIQLLMLVVVLMIYGLTGVGINISILSVLFPVIIIQVAMLGLGCGIIIAACTTKYRDLSVLVSFGIQLWMYASPVVYVTSSIPKKYMTMYMCNPMSPIIDMWRYCILGTGNVNYLFWGISWATTVVLLIVGIMLFSRVEKTFMDTV